MEKRASPVHRVSDHLHLAVFASIVGLIVLLVASAALDFGDRGTAGYLISVVTGFFVIAIGIPYVLWRVRRRYSGERVEREEPLREWLRGDCDTWQSRLTGREAAVQALLPIAAVAFGMFAIGIVAHQVL